MRVLRRAISWWKSKSGGGGAYSTGAVETRGVREHSCADELK